jgi:2,3-bisphosphoglycerate-dependent phosphoglycerate mutase
MLDDLHARHLVGVADVQEIWMIRHADAYVGLESLNEGVLDPPLSGLGLDQASRLARRLSEVPIGAVWSSSLRRATETAEAVARPHGLGVRQDERLREVRTDWDEGRSGSLKDPGVYPFLEPESEVVERMSSVVADVVAGLEPTGPQRAAVVTHNAAIALYVSSVLGLSWGQLRIMPQYTSVSVLAVKDGQVVVHSLADATHLTAQPHISD